MISLPVDRWWSSFPDDPDGPSSSTLNCVADCQHHCCSQHIVAAYDVDEVYDEWDIIVIQRWWRSFYTVHDHSSSSNGPLAFNSMVSWLGSGQAVKAFTVDHSDHRWAIRHQQGTVRSTAVSGLSYDQAVFTVKEISVRLRSAASVHLGLIV